MTDAAAARRLAAALLLCASTGCIAEDDAAPPRVPEDSVPEAARYGGTLVIGAITDVADLSPLTFRVQNALYIQQFVLFLPLLTYDADLKPVPRLARSWDIAEDGAAITGDGDDEFFDPADTETVNTIKELIETRVRPAVANDGGDITFRGF